MSGNFSSFLPYVCTDLSFTQVSFGSVEIVSGRLFPKQATSDLILEFSADDSFEWFQGLLMAIEEQDLGNVSAILDLSRINSSSNFSVQFIEIHTYLTAKVKDDDINNIVANE